MAEGSISSAEPAHPFRLAGLVAAAGLLIVVVSLPLPFASNEAGDLDHHTDAHTWFIWLPGHNVGAPLLLIGVFSSVVIWRFSRWRRNIVLWIGSSLGWMGLGLLWWIAPFLIGEGALYGTGVDLDLWPTRWVVATGWMTLWFGAALCAVRTSDG